MSSDATIREVLERYRSVAVYGMSKNPEKAAHTVPAYLLSHGFTVFPINPSAEEILGLKCYDSVGEVEGSIEILDVFRPAHEAPAIVEEAVERKGTRGDVAVIWLQEGIINDEAKHLAEEAGITFIQDRCIYKELRRLASP